MATIGQLNATTVDGQQVLRGRIGTLKLDEEVILRPTGSPRDDNRPSHRVYAQRANDNEVEVGAAWTKTFKATDGSLNEMLSINLDDPSFDRPINVAAFPNGEPGRFDIRWRRRQDRHAR